MRLTPRAAALLGRWQIIDALPLSGGSVAQSWRVQSASGPIFLKSHEDPPPRLFEREAAGLTALRATGALAVPQVLAAEDAGVVLEWIDVADATTTTEATEAEFGRNLAALHRHTGSAFGSMDEVFLGYLGSVALDLTPCRTYAESYLERRVSPLVQRAVNEQDMDPAAMSLVDELLATPQVCGPPEPPTLVHGDLWSGNRVIGADGRSWLIDPSAHYGHRESDLAMMRLFGGFGETCFTAYHDVFPLAPGWRDRVALYQLVPLLAHVIMFGRAYEPAVMRALRSLT
ncbi:MAG: fructosamine kinase family protein [Ornithinimicrobium sp.]